MSNGSEQGDPKANEKQPAFFVAKWKGSANTNGVEEDLNEKC